MPLHGQCVQLLRAAPHHISRRLTACMNGVIKVYEHTIEYNLIVAEGACDDW